MITNKFFVFLICLLINSCILSAESVIDSTQIYGIWTKDNSPYLIHNDIEIPEDTSLYIDSGVEIIFQGHYKIEIYGGFRAEGKIFDTIFFYINDTAGFSNVDASDGSWEGIDIDQPNDSPWEINFSYCKFKYSKGLGFDEGGVINFINNSKLVIIDHCTFQNNYGYFGGGIYYDGVFNQGDIRILNCNFQNNSAFLGGAIYLYWYNHDNLISHNNFYNNRANSGGAIFITGRKISHNLFYRNIADDKGGAVCTGGSTSLVVENSIFNENEGPCGGAYYVNNGAYGAKIMNCTMINNISDSAVLYIGSNSVDDFQIINSIIWNPGSQSIRRESSETDISVTFSLIQYTSDSIWFSESCLDLFPGITAPEQHDYHLNRKSPAIETGSFDTTGFQLSQTDFYGNPRIYNERIDMGAVEFDSLIFLNMPGNTFKDAIRIYPNPANSQMTIDPQNIRTVINELALFDYKGSKVKLIYPPPANARLLNMDNLLPGVYFLRVKFINGYSYSEKIIIN